MVEMKMPEVRLREQNRIQRSRVFFLEVNIILTNIEDQVEVDLDVMTNNQLFNMWYRIQFRSISLQIHV